MTTETAALPAIAAWESFYVIVGSSAAALTGLQFVVIALIADSETQAPMPTIRAFATPTIVHFCSVLLVSAVLSAPWPGFSSVAVGLGVCGAIGVLYAAMIIHRARRQSGYKPVLSDWVWHCVLPLSAYTTVLVSAIFVQHYSLSSLFAVAAAVILLLFIGIHNAWDTVTYVVVERSGRKDSPP